MKKLIWAIFPFVLLAGLAVAQTTIYTINHGVCVNATATTNVTVKDCGGVPLLTSAIGSTVQAYNSLLTSLAGGTALPVANGGSGSTTASGARTAFGVTATGADAAYAYRTNNLSDLASASTSRTNLGVAIGSNVEAWDADLDALAALSSTAGIVKRTGAGTFGLAVSGTDFAPATSGSSLLLGSSGGFASFGGSSPTTCTNQFLRNITISAVGVVTNTCGSIAAADLPNPGASSLGGIQSSAAVSHQWINSISTSGVPAKSQPACADLSDAGTVCPLSGTWTPSFSGLTTVGTVTITGYYRKSGGMVYVSIWISPGVGATSSSAGGGGTTITNPPYSSVDRAVLPVSDVLTGIGDAVIVGSTIYPPAWAATNDNIYISGTFAN